MEIGFKLGLGTASMSLFLIEFANGTSFTLMKLNLISTPLQVRHL
jgi:hypothetical protein